MCFNIPFGRCRWLRMPFGIAPTPEEFQRRQHQVLKSLPGVLTIHDDILLYGEGDTYEEASRDHDANKAPQTYDALQRAKSEAQQR